MQKTLLFMLFILSFQTHANDNEDIVSSGYKPVDESENTDTGYIVKSDKSENLATENKNMPEILCSYAPSQTEAFKNIVEKENLVSIGSAIAEKVGVALIVNQFDVDNTKNFLANNAEKKIRGDVKEKFSNYCNNFISRALTSADSKEKASLCKQAVFASTTLSKSFLSQNSISATTAAPFVIDAALVLAGTAVTVELMCAPINHPELTAKVVEASKEFGSQTQTHISKASDKAATVGNNLKPVVSNISINVKQYKDKFF